MTALLLRVSWRVIDLQVLALLAGLMVLAGLAEAAGLFAGLRRRLLRLPPGAALWVSLVVVAATSAAILNDAAVVVLVPLLLPALRGMGLRPVPVVVLMAVAANVGSLLTPFGNPQNAVLARAAGLDVVDFVRTQALFVVLGLALLAIPSWRLGRRLAAIAAEAPAHVAPHGRTWLVVCILLFLAAAIAAPRFDVGLGTVALAAAALALAGLWLSLGRVAGRAAWRCLDWNVLLLFVGLYLLTAGLPSWFPAARVPTAQMDGPWTALIGVTVLSNLVGNVPAVLTFLSLDAAWTVGHAEFLVTVSTLGGALFLTGSAASLLAADQARKCGVEVRFLPFLRHALPWTLPVLLLGAYVTW